MGDEERGKVPVTDLGLQVDGEVILRWAARWAGRRGWLSMMQIGCGVPVRHLTEEVQGKLST